MRILVVHNKYRTRGGEDEVRESERALLTSHGHDVFDYVVDNSNFSDYQAAWIGLQAVWNQGAFNAIRRRIDEVRPDLMHTHNLHPQISPAAYYAAALGNVAAVHTLHSYKMMCPKGQLFREGHLCELCVGKTIAWPGVMRGCYRGSRAATAAVAAVFGLHRIVGTWKDKVDLYFAQTEFAKRKYVESGLPENKIRVKPNFVADAGVGLGDGGYALFVGRLNEEKGVPVLLDAWRSIGLSLPLQICGTGPLESIVRSAKVPGVEYLGVRPLTEILKRMKRAVVVIVPSVWYEGTPRTTVEAYACGTPVIASRLGAMELNVKHGVTGLHFEPGNAAALAGQVRMLLESPEHLAAMRVSARREYETHYTAESNYSLLMRCYNEAIDIHRSKLQVLQSAKSRPSVA
jgi:glycosyltransferase involved in cell wall biosynthesis